MSGTTTTPNEELAAAILRHRVGRSDSTGRISSWRELTCTADDLLQAMAIRWDECHSGDEQQRITPAAHLVIRDRGLDHWVLWGVERGLGPGAYGYGARIGGHEVQIALAPDGRHSLLCTCPWWRQHYAAGRPCEHLLALELVMEACAVARRRAEAAGGADRGRAAAGSSRQQRRAAERAAQRGR